MGEGEVNVAMVAVDVDEVTPYSMHVSSLKFYLDHSDRLVRCDKSFILRARGHLWYNKWTRLPR